MRELGLHRFEQRKATVLTVLDHLGDVQLVDAGRDRRNRLVRFEVHAPGHGLTPQGIFIYAEWYQRVTRGWRLSRYQYDYLDRRRGGRLGYHWHPVIRRRGVYHAHCEERIGIPSIDHYRSYEVDLLEAHEEFVKLLFTDRSINCSGLRPLI